LTRVEYLYLTAAGILWGSGHPVIRYILAKGNSQMNALHIAFLSTIVGLILLSAVLAQRQGLHRLKMLGRRGIIVAGAIGCLQYGLYPIMSYTALSYIPASLNAIIVGSSPILIALLSRVLLQERLRAVGYAGILLAFVGLFILVGGYGAESASLLGLALSATGALVASIYAVAGRYLMRSHDALAVSQLGISAGLLVLAYVTYSLTGFGGLFASASMDLLLVTYWGIAVTMGNLLFYLALKKLDAARAGSFFFVSPIAAASLSVIFLGEPLTVLMVLGMVATLMGIRLTQLAVVRRAAGS